MAITLNGNQINQLQEFVFPDGEEPDQLTTEVTICYYGKDSILVQTEDNAEPGYYVHFSEYPEEGLMFLKPDDLMFLNPGIEE